MTSDHLIQQMAEFIAKQTEFYKQVRHGLPLPVARLLCNPGLLTSWRRTGQDYWPVTHGYVDFRTEDLEPNEKDGWDALRTQCRINISKRLSIREFFAGRGGAAHYRGFVARRDADKYIRAASSFFGLSPDYPLINLVTEVVMGTGWKVRTSSGLIMEGEKWQMNVAPTAGIRTAVTCRAR
jgi:hypothetical protein